MPEATYDHEADILYVRLRDGEAWSDSRSFLDDLRIGDRRVLRLPEVANAGVIEAGLEVDVVRGTDARSDRCRAMRSGHLRERWYRR